MSKKEFVGLYKFKRKIPDSVRIKLRQVTDNNTVIKIRQVTEEDFENDTEAFSIKNILSYYFPSERLVEERKEVNFSNCEEIPTDDNEI